LDYALKGKEEFNTFLEDGNCDVSNNTVENAIRPFVIG
jgi:transposase